MYSTQIVTFISVAESGSFSKSAEALYITPTAVMKQINALEKRLAVTLFDRTNHGLRLTPAGKSILQDAKYIMDYSARAVEKAREIDERENKKAIRIGTSVMTPAKFVLDIWEDIQNIAPNMKIELIPFDNTPENAREILKNLGQHIDIVAGMYDDNLMNERGFQAVRLEDKRVSFAVPITNSLAKRDFLSKNELNNAGVLFIKKGWNRYIDGLREQLENSGVKIIDFEFFNLSAFNRAVQENIPIIAIDGWENIHPLLKIIPIEWECRVPFGIMYSRQPSKHVEKFIGIVKNIIF